MIFSHNSRRLLLSIALFLAAVALLIAAAGASATSPDLGQPFVYRALETPIGGEGFAPVGLRILNLGSPPSAARVLTEDPADSSPAMSPDGRTVVFAGREGLFLIGADGAGLRQLTHPGPAAGDGDPSFAPSGKRIVFARLEDETVRGTNQGDIYSIGIDGTGLRQITSGPAADGSPAMSPNGRQIVFSRRTRTEPISDVYSVRPSGSHLRNLTPRIPARHRRTEKILAAAEPTFSPNGRVIAFAVSANGAENIDTMRPNGTHIRPLTGIGHRALSRRFGLSEPAFSPSGRSLLVAARDTYHRELAVISLADRSRLFTPYSPQGDSPAW